jgi:5-methylcytosine-specific restriction endonuclease McrA
VPATVRSAVLERDRHRCRYGGCTDGLDVHHITYRSEGVDHQAQNLITLCRKHHDLVHRDKPLWQPLLRAYIWLYYLEGRQLYLVDIRRLATTM